VKCPGLALGLLLCAVLPVHAQSAATSRFLCSPEFLVEPTITFERLWVPRTTTESGAVTRDRREAEFEVILSLGLPTRVSWLEFAVEAIFLPFDADSTPELEFETILCGFPRSARPVGSARILMLSINSARPNGPVIVARTPTN
jgi:hypothetical protein